MLDKILSFAADILTRIVTLIDHDSGWKDVPAGDATGYTKFNLSNFKYRTKGGQCYLDFYNNVGSMTTGWKNVGRLPQGARPSKQLNSSMCNRSGQTCEIQIFTNGNVFLYANTTMGTMSHFICYPCTDGGVLLKPVFATLTAIPDRIGGGMNA